MRYTPDEFAKFQELAAKCYFCGAPHSGVGYESLVPDIADGSQPWIGFYFCDGCTYRRPEFEKIEQAKMKRRRLIESLATHKFYRHDDRFDLETRRESMSEIPGMFDELGKYPLEKNPWIWSPTCGIGKTDAARCVATNYINDLKGVVELNGAKLHDLGEFWAATRAKEMENYERVPLLIVDDFDKALWTLKSVNIVYRIWNERYDQKLPTIVTSNCEPDALCKRWDMLDKSMSYGSAIRDRMCPMAVFEMKGEPRR